MTFPHDREHGWLTEEDSTDMILRSLASWATSVKFFSGELEHGGMATGSPMDQSSPEFLMGVGERIDRAVDLLRARVPHGEPPAAAPLEIYEQYHQRVVAAIRKQMLARWPPTNREERHKIAQNVMFFDVECDYHDEFAEGLDPEEMADDQINAAL